VPSLNCILSGQNGQTSISLHSPFWPLKWPPVSCFSFPLLLSQPSRWDCLQLLQTISWSSLHPLAVFAQSFWPGSSPNPV
jgi:hypothetical protein